MNMDIEKGAVDIEEGKRDKSMQEKNIRRQNESFDCDPRKAFESNIDSCICILLFDKDKEKVIIGG